LPRRRRDLDETRTLLLETGAEMILESGVTVALDHVGLIDVCRRAGFKSAGSGYKIWATQDEFHRDLLRHVAETSIEAEPGVASLEWLLDEVGRGPDAFVEALRRASNLQAEFLADYPEYEIYLALWLARRSDPGVARAVTETDRQILVAYAAEYERVFDAVDREFVDPFTPEAFAVALSALTEGMQIRLGSDPDFVPPSAVHALAPDDVPREWHLFSACVWAIANMMTRPRAEGPRKRRG